MTVTAHTSLFAFAPHTPAPAETQVEIDVAARQVVRHGREVPLTRLEFDLLVFLARHPRRVFTRDQLLRNVWGYDIAGPRTVDVHITRLRGQAGRAGGAHHLRRRLPPGRRRRRDADGRRLVGPEQVQQPLRVALGVVGVAVVHQHVGLVGLVGQLAQLRRPLLQLAAASTGSRTSRRCPCWSTCRCGRGSAPPPGPRSPPAPAGSTTCGPAACRRRRTAAGARAGTPASRPGCRPSNQDALRNSNTGRSGLHRGAHLEQVLLVGPPDGEPRRELEQQRAQLAGLDQRVERATGTGSRSPRTPAAAGRSGRCSSCRSPAAGPCRSRDTLVGCPVSRLNALMLNGEAGRRALRPQRGGLLGRRRVVGRVHLDQRELPGVVGQPLLRVVGGLRIPARREQRLVGPRRGADPDLAHPITLSGRDRSAALRAGRPPAARASACRSRRWWPRGTPPAAPPGSALQQPSQ